MTYYKVKPEADNKRLCVIKRGAYVNGILELYALHKSAIYSVLGRYHVLKIMEIN